MATRQSGLSFRTDRPESLALPRVFKQFTMGTGVLGLSTNWDIDISVPQRHRARLLFLQAQMTAAGGTSTFTVQCMQTLPVLGQVVVWQASINIAGAASFNGTFFHGASGEKFDVGGATSFGFASIGIPRDDLWSDFKIRLTNINGPAGWQIVTGQATFEIRPVD